MAASLAFSRALGLSEFQFDVSINWKLASPSVDMWRLQLPLFIVMPHLGKALEHSQIDDWEEELVMLAITGIDDAISFAELSRMTHSICCEVGVGCSTKMQVWSYSDLRNCWAISCYSSRSDEVKLSGLDQSGNECIFIPWGVTWVGSLFRRCA